MKVTKLKSGNYNVRVFSHMENGKRIYKSFTSKNKYELYDLVYQFKHQKSPNIGTVGEIMDKYIELNKLTFSPTTLYVYQSVRNTCFQDLMKMDVSCLTDIIVQEEINKELERTFRGKRKSPATVKSQISKVFASIKKFTGKTFSVDYPKEKEKIIELPEIEDVYNAIHGTDIELPCLLSMWLSFTASEIRGLTPDSIRNGYIYIDKVRVTISGGCITKDRGKTGKRNRRVRLPEEIFNLIKETDGWKNGGFLVPTTVSTLNIKLKKILSEHGIYGMTFHSLRHLNASMMLKLNIPLKYAMERGGWNNPKTIQNVYQHTFTKERDIVDDKIDDYMKCITSMHHGN